MKTYVVIGLGRFGTAVAAELCKLGHEVLAIDGDEGRVQAIADHVTHAVTGDARDPAVLRALGVRNYDCAIVAVAFERFRTSSVMQKALTGIRPCCLGLILGVVFTMASNYNRLCRPALVMVRGGKARLAVRRQTFADLVACDL